MNDRLATSKKLAQIFKVPLSTIQSWNRVGMIHGRLVKHEFHFLLSNIDQLLQASAVNYKADKVPKMLDLLEDRNRLLTCQEAAERLGQSEFNIFYLISHSNFPAFRFTRKCIRVAEDEIVKRLDTRAVEEFDAQLIPKVLGISIRGMGDELILQGKLKRSRRGQLDKASVRSLLRELLPEGVDPNDWIDQRIVATDALIPADRAAKQMKVHYHTFLQMLEEEKTICLCYKKGKKVTALFVQEGDLKYLKILNVRDLCRIFGVKEQFAQSVLEGTERICKTSGHPKSCTRKACMIKLLKNLANKMVNVELWYRTQLEEDSLPLLSFHAAMQKFELPARKTKDKFQKGQIPAIRRLDHKNEWCLRQETFMSDRE